MLEPRNYWNFSMLQPRPCLLKTLAEQNEPTSPDMVWTFMTLAIRNGRFLAIPQLRGRSWGCNIGNTAGSLRISMKVSNPRGFFGGNLWEDDSMLTKSHARHMDLIVFDGEASQPASFHRFSSFDLGFVFFGKSHECFFSLKSCISSSRLFGSKSLSMRTRICMPHVTWCLHQALLPQRQRRVWQEVGGGRSQPQSGNPMGRSRMRCEDAARSNIGAGVWAFLSKLWSTIPKGKPSTTQKKRNSKIVLVQSPTSAEKWRQSVGAKQDKKGKKNHIEGVAASAWRANSPEFKELHRF